MSNQASELFELCKEVYKRTHWEDTLQFYDWFKDIYSEGEYEDYGMWHSFIKGSYDVEDGQVPLYTSDYLLEKLPQSIDAGRSFAVDMFLVLDRPKSLKYRYRAFYTAPSYGKRNEVVANTPLLSLLKLTIVLSEAGELDNDQSS